MTFADRVIGFNRALSFKGKLPEGIRIMNPFRENEEILPVSETFYRKFYSDNNQRRLILGINPGRLGAGATGIPFTDTKRLSEICGLRLTSVSTHEPSSVFIYDLINRYGGPESFYHDFYIHSVCPLGFIRLNPAGRWINCNYYDDDRLFASVRSFIISSLKAQINFGTDTSVCFVLGKKNAACLERINREEKLFGKLVVLEHPRFIIQYRRKAMEAYLADYLTQLRDS